VVGQTRAARRRLAIEALAQLLVPFAALNALDVALQLLVAELVGADLLDNLGAVGGVELLDELGEQVLVLQRFLDGGQRGSGGLALAGVRAVGCVAVVGLLQLQFQLATQALKVEAAQGIRAQTAALEEGVARDIRVGLEQLRRLGEGIWRDAIALEALEDEQRLEGGVGGNARRHAPGSVDGVGGARRAGRLGWEGSQGEGGRPRRASQRAGGHGRAAAR
jgi:hypothetical protein